MFQKVTQKVWFVVLVGLLLGLACGAVMARWSSLRGVAAGVAVVGVLLLGRVVGWLRQVVLGLATGLVAVATAPLARRFGVPESTWTFGLGVVVGVVWSIVGAVRRRRKATEKPAASIDLDSKQLRFVDNEKPATEGKETLFELMQKLKASRRRIKLMEPLWAEIERISKLSDDELTATRSAHSTAQFACSQPPSGRNRNASVSKGPVYARIATPENIRIERLARLLHDAGRSAVEPSGAFVEWDDAPERTRAGRRSQAQYLLAAGVVLPTSPADAAQIKRDYTQAAEKLKGDPKLADNAKAHEQQPLQGFPTDDEIRAWRWWERRSQHSQTGKRDTWKIVELYFDSGGFLVDGSNSYVLRLADGTQVGELVDGEYQPLLNAYRAAAWRKAPAPTTQIAPAADREAAAK